MEFGEVRIRLQMGGFLIFPKQNKQKTIGGFARKSIKNMAPPAAWTLFYISTGIHWAIGTDVHTAAGENFSQAKPGCSPLVKRLECRAVWIKVTVTFTTDFRWTRNSPTRLLLRNPYAFYITFGQVLPKEEMSWSTKGSEIFALIAILWVIRTCTSKVKCAMVKFGF